jgi:hypothetical protein
MDKSEDMRAEAKELKKIADEIGNRKGDELVPCSFLLSIKALAESHARLLERTAEVREELLERLEKLEERIDRVQFPSDPMDE